MPDDTVLDELTIDRTERVPADTLRVDGDNPNEQADETFGHLVDGLQSRWVGGPIVANTGALLGYDDEPEGLICDGEHRWRAAQEAGLDAVPVRFVDFDDDAQRRSSRNYRGPHYHARLIDCFETHHRPTF